MLTIYQSDLQKVKVHITSHLKCYISGLNNIQGGESEKCVISMDSIYKPMQ